MRNYETEFSSSLLFIARQDAQHFGVDIPKGLTSMFQSDATGKKYYYVYSKEHGLVWEGYALNANYAKAKYINSLIENTIDAE